MKPMEPIKPMAPMKPMKPLGGDGDPAWWPAELGQPASSGAQGGMRYAFFPEKRRLLVEQDGKLTTYDSGERRITGVSQQAGGAQSLAFSSEDGAVKLQELKRI